MAKSKSPDENRILELMEERAEAIRIRDIEGAVAHYAKDVVVFDVIGPLQLMGSESPHKRLEDWFATFEGPIGFELEDITVVTDGSIAWCHSFNHVSALTIKGEKLDMWWRETLGWQRTDGRWLVMHAHSSVPFDARSGKASVGLQPYGEIKES